MSARAPRSTGFVVFSTAMVLLTTAIAAAAFWPVYENWRFVLMAGVTMVVGAAIALLGARYRWSSAVVLAATLGAFLLLGVPLAVPGQAIFGVLPSLAGMIDLLGGAAVGWMRLLTISLPVGSYEGLLVPAFLLILLTVVVALSLALRAPRSELAVIAPALLLLAGLAFGPERAPLALPLGLAFLIAALAWLSWRRWYRRRESIRALVAANAGGESPHSGTAIAPGARVKGEGTAGLRTVGAAGLVLLVAAGSGLAASALLPAKANREVLRTAVEQPFNPRDYASPLSGFRRYFQPGLAEQTLFTVTGLPPAARLRLATLDSYDGIVYSLGGPQETSLSGSFTRVPTGIDQSAVAGTAATVEVTIGGYSGVWLPTLGQLRSIRFDGEANGLRDTFFYNDNGGTAVVVDGLSEGDRYTLSAVIPEPPQEQSIAGLIPGTAELPALGTLPDELAAALDRYIGDATSQGEQLEAMLAGLTSEGYISHGVGDAEPPSRSGHGADRIAQLLGDSRMIGDQEQYAVAAALMARDLGFPARVVLGFDPQIEDGAATAVRGSDLSAWIEVNTTRYGWVTLDPTPPLREIPEELPEDPTLVARPQSPVPPSTVELEPNNEQIPLDTPQEEETPDNAFAAMLLGVLAIAGWTLLGLALVFSPFLLILAAKAQRRRRRRSEATPALRIRGGWQEFEDAVVDHGFRTPPSPTRSEVAHTVGGLRPLVLAAVADRATFAPEQADAAEADQLWLQLRELRASLDEGRTRWERLGARVSMRSLGGYSLKEIFTRERRP